MHMSIDYEYMILKDAIDKKHKWSNTKIICLKVLYKTTIKEY